MNEKIQLTVITAQDPPVLSKSFRLDDSGELVKESGGKLFRGQGQVAEPDSIVALADILNTLEPNQALTYGVPIHEKVGIVPKKEVPPEDQINGFPVLSRTRENWRYPDDQGIFMIDVDGPETSEEQIRAKLKKVLPELTGCPSLTRPSASSLIFKDGQEKPLRGVTGHRILIPVSWNAIAVLP